LSALRSELEESRRLLQLRNQELEALQARVAAGDALPAPVQTPATGTAAPGVDLEAEVEERLFADEPLADDASGDAVEPEAVVAAGAAAAPAAVQPTTTPVIRTAPAAPEPSLLAKVLG